MFGIRSKPHSGDQLFVRGPFEPAYPALFRSGEFAGAALWASIPSLRGQDPILRDDTDLSHECHQNCKYR
jgi:hypothetical protein